MNPFYTGLLLGGIAGFVLGKFPWWIIVLLIIATAMGLTYKYGTEQLENLFDSEE